MFYGRASAFWTLVVVTVLTCPAVGQLVISTRSGIVHFFEGAVYLGDQPLESHPGKFPSVPPGAELRTTEGRVEVLLTPGVFVRIGEWSTIRMIANQLSDTRVELLAGSAVVDSAEPSSGTSVTLIYKNWSVRFLEQGVYRIDSDPPRLWVLQGKAEVSADTHGEALSVGHGIYVPFAPALVPDRSIDPPRDALSLWAEGRQQSISADNAIAANIQDPASIDTSNSGHSFTLPRYTYLPLLLGLAAEISSVFSPHASSSTAPRRNFLLSPFMRSRSARWPSDTQSASPGVEFVRPVQLFRPILAGVPLHLAIAVRPVARAGMHGGVHR
jgi:hypothetical protein